MPSVYDRSTGTRVAMLSDAAFERLRTMLESFAPDDEQYPIDPRLLDQLADAGLEEEVLTLLRQNLEGRESFDLGLTAN